MPTTCRTHMEEMIKFPNDKGGRKGVKERGQTEGEGIVKPSIPSPLLCKTSISFPRPLGERGESGEGRGEVSGTLAAQLKVTTLALWRSLSLSLLPSPR